MPTVLRIAGYRFFFFSNEGTEPPHVHVERDDEYAKVWLQPVVVAWSKGFHRHEIAQIVWIVEANRRGFQEAWDDHFEH